MLHLKKVLDAKPKEHVEVVLKPLTTVWGENLDPDHVHEEHPTPQFARSTYAVLNGKWDYAIVAGTHDPNENLQAVVEAAAMPDLEAFEAQIVVPFSPEASLSGVGRRLEPTELLWYRRVIEEPAHKPGERVILHFQAVDYACSVRVNGEAVGSHAGGYTPFAFDITDQLVSGENELVVCVADPSEYGSHPRGKQRFDRGDIWYSAQSGIWQTVWTEIVPDVHISSAVIEPEADSGILVVGVRVAGVERDEASVDSGAADAGAGTADGAVERAIERAERGAHAKPVECADESVAGGAGAGAGAGVAAAATRGPLAKPALRLEVYDAENMRVAVAQTSIDGSVGAVAVHIPDLHKWSPADPYLYRLVMRCGSDAVESYCGFRTVEIRTDDAGRKRIFLNGEPLFIKGVLDQAYWPDGLMTAPSDEALVFDIETMRANGFNLMRKHIKVETDRWYYHCDRLGMLVLQDMVSGGDTEIRSWQWSYKPTLFKISWNHYRDDVPKHWEELGAGDVRYRNEWSTMCKDVIHALHNHPCIIGWSLFNEGWGQFGAANAEALVRSLDPTRLVDAVSGWYDQRCGDFYSVHNYFRDMDVWKDQRDRAFFISEFGGFTHPVKGHSSLDKAYGYELHEDRDEWKAAVLAHIAEVEALESKGLVGYVYTQVSDIEEETNGILTYDRRVNKLAD